MKRANAGELMNAIPIKKRKATAGTYVPKVYATPGIPYGISKPDAYWRIKKGLPPADYWRKRYYRRRITGKGDYSFKSSRSTGANWGGYLGSKAGEFAGGAIQSGLSSILKGFGDYSVRKNVFMSGRLPTVHNATNTGGTVIRYQEYLQDIYTSSTAGLFQQNNIIINAANPLCFPFLSQIAANYEQYEIEGMLFEFRSTSADALNSVNTALGTVMMATQYDVNDPLFQSKYDLLNYEFSSSVKPSCSALHMVECDPRQTPVAELYTLWNQQAPPANADPRLYNLGRFTIATQGFQGTSVNIGELHVTYQIKLLKPKLFMALGYNINYYHSVITAWSNALPLGTAASTVTTTSNNPLIAINQANRYIQFPPSTAEISYIVCISWISAGANTAVAYPSLTYTACSANGNTPAWAPASGDTVYSMTLFLEITTDGSGTLPLITLGTGGALPGTSGGSTQSALEVWVSQKTS